MMSGKNSSLPSNVLVRQPIIFLVLFLLALAACVPALTPVPSPTARAESTLTPTATPTLTPTTTPTVTPTPTPTPLPHPAAFDDAFTRGLIRYENGQWLVSVVQTADGGQQTADDGRQTVELVLLPDTFNTNDALRARNPLAPLTVRARPLSPTPLPLGEGTGVREHTLLWNPDTAEFRLAPALPAIYEGVNTDHPTFNPEAFAQIPRFTIEDIQSGLAVQSLLAHIQDRLTAGESLSDILYLDPDAVRQNWQKLGGNSLLFELLRGGKIAKLKAKGNDQGSATIRYDNLTMKLLPLGANIQINGEDYFAFYLANFDPLDPENPDPNNLANWKFFLSIPSNENVLWEKGFGAKAPFVPYILLYGDEKYQQNQPLLARLLGIEGNDARNLVSSDPDALYFPSAMTYLEDLGKTELGYGNTIEMPFPSGVRIPFEIQTMGPFIFEVGVAR